MRHYVVVSEDPDLEVARDLAASLLALHASAVDMMDINDYRQHEADLFRVRAFVIFIGANPVSAPYIDRMQVHDLHSCVKWGVNPGRAAAVWLDRRRPPSVLELARLLGREERAYTVPESPPDVFRQLAGSGPLTRFGLGALALFCRPVRRRLQYTLGVLDFLKHQPWPNLV
jgi:hypothetical protein